MTMCRLDGWIRGLRVKVDMDCALTEFFSHGELKTFLMMSFFKREDAKLKSFKENKI